MAVRLLGMASVLFALAANAMAVEATVLSGDEARAAIRNAVDSIKVEREKVKSWQGELTVQEESSQKEIHVLREGVSPAHLRFGSATLDQLETRKGAFSVRSKVVSQFALKADGGVYVGSKEVEPRVATDAEGNTITQGYLPRSDQDMLVEKERIITAYRVLGSDIAEPLPRALLPLPKHTVSIRPRDSYSLSFFADYHDPREVLRVGGSPVEQVLKNLLLRDAAQQPKTSIEAGENGGKRLTLVSKYRAEKAPDLVVTLVLEEAWHYLPTRFIEVIGDTPVESRDITYHQVDGVILPLRVTVAKYGQDKSLVLKQEYDIQTIRLNSPEIEANVSSLKLQDGDKVGDQIRKEQFIFLDGELLSPEEAKARWQAKHIQN